MLYSPINYQGNKSRIVNEILKLFPKEVNGVREIFCGSAIVSLSSLCDSVYLNDKNDYILKLIDFFNNNEAEDIINKTDKIIEKYGLTNTYYEGKSKYIEKKHEGLSRYNKEGYEKLKKDYNKDKDLYKLFVLIIYGFNHYLRFNKKDEYNVPVGKVDFVESLRKKTIDYCAAIKNKKIHITNYDFKDERLYKDVNKKDLFYFDPPYLITMATYNSCWNEEDEKNLLQILDDLNDKGYNFMLSNVIESNGKKNVILKEWMKKYHIHYVKRQYLNASYNKKNLTNAIEVVITNY